MVLVPGALALFGAWRAKRRADAAGEGALRAEA
jgi:hypothetical protein